MMEAIQYVEINEFGSAVVVGRRLHVSDVGLAYEGGFSEEEILEWMKLTKEEFHGVLAYFYRHREEIIARVEAANELARKLSSHTPEDYERWKRALAEKKAQDNQE